MDDVITGLACPNCAGTLSIQEGQRIIKCPYCEARSQVVGDEGVRRYQVARKVAHPQAQQAVQRFWQGLNRAMDLSSQAQITELFLVYLPYWRAQAQVFGWVFGQKSVRSGKSHRYEPREVQVVEQMDWTGAAADVGEFGVTSLNLKGVQFAAYAPEALHAEGMVFEASDSRTDAYDTATQRWDNRVRERAGLDRVEQVFVRFLRETLALVYYPLWVARYTYRRRVYQVVVDGHRGQVLYGKAPGNIWYRALMLVGGTALGSFVLVDGLAIVLSMLANMRGDKDRDVGFLLLLPLVVGAGLIFGGYRLFRWGEEIEEKAHTP